ncbi:MAG: hypothetical protein JNM02_07845 [Anaerolineales bacterium]|nr:hypothetical protein [Anaerolineales bacterium]
MKKILPLLLLWVFTACNTATPMPPTVTPTLTLAPTATVTPTATPVPEGPCVSPFLPLITGNEWTYRATSRSGESLYKLRTLDRNDGRNIVIMVEFADPKHEVTVIEPVVCMDGAVENFPLFVVSMHFADYLEKDFNTYHDTGIYAPSYQTFVGNDWVMDWDLDYLTESSTQLKNPVDGQTLFVMQSSFIKLSFEMDGTREAVTVPAGSYPQALKVQYTFSFPVTLLLLNESVGGTLTVNTIQWYEPYVGLVRAQIDSASVLLYGKEIDISMVSMIELVEFNQAE